MELFENTFKELSGSPENCISLSAVWIILWGKLEIGLLQLYTVVQNIVLNCFILHWEVLSLESYSSLTDNSFSFALSKWRASFESSAFRILSYFALFLKQIILLEWAQAGVLCCIPCPHGTVFFELQYINISTVTLNNIEQWMKLNYFLSCSWYDLIQVNFLFCILVNSSISHLLYLTGNFPPVKMVLLKFKKRWTDFVLLCTVG